MPDPAPPDPLSPHRPTPLGRPWLRNRWDELTFLHWRYPADIVQAMLPPGLRADTFDGSAWVSLVPFLMRRAAPALLPALPWLSTFAETNVRTYVVDRRGNRAIWFFSLDAARLPVVAFARWTIGFPYVWSRMTLDVDGARRTYRLERRRWPRRPPARSLLRVDVGDPITTPGDLDLFLTARWGTVAEWRGTLRHHPVDHPRWELHEAALVTLADTTVTAAGLPAPTTEPIVRWARPLDAVFGRPERV